VILYSQKSVDSNLITNSIILYEQGLKFKNGDNGSIDYNKAFKLFSASADLGNAQAIYAKAYMLYKGFGCDQNYIEAAKLFAIGARENRDNSMYFYGLCLRNGYGVKKNEDSAKYYLQLSSDLGYGQAVEELKMPQGENENDSAKFIVTQIKNLALPETFSINKFTKIRSNKPINQVINGQYKGWMIHYDWSGTEIVSCSPLQINLKLSNNIVSGSWLGKLGDTTSIAGILNGNEIRFKDMESRRIDHYSPNESITYNFQKANFNVVQSSDSVYLAGNVEMFSPQRNEPSKPIYIAMIRSNSSDVDTVKIKEEVIHLNAFPNPFSSILNVEFKLSKSENVLIQLVNNQGDIVYTKSGGMLTSGQYRIPIQISGLISGIYFLKIIHNDQISIIKVIAN
jgi:hypothetical protein